MDFVETETSLNAIYERCPQTDTDYRFSRLPENRSHIRGSWLIAPSANVERWSRHIALSLMNKTAISMANRNLKHWSGENVKIVVSQKHSLLIHSDGIITVELCVALSNRNKRPNPIRSGFQPGRILCKFGS
uniref:Uncharacterized protein n=1 Tax=Spongospora subterranea TaxID=70186 RepID=A0A0H5QSC6_9EUKA|eukprot:CRZ04870.1 hypothetical protein [Spongospora subterranea]